MIVVVTAWALACAAAASPAVVDGAVEGGVDRAVRESVAEETAGTTVRARRPADLDDVRIDEAAAVAPEEALLAVPGVSLVRSGGPLSPVRPVVRGLSGSRLDVSVLGLSFTDPAAGDVDAGLWPWALGSVDVDVGAGGAIGGALGGALGGSVAMKRPPPGLVGNVTAGALSTFSGALRVVGDGGRRGVAVSAGSTRGDFAYVALDAGEQRTGRAAAVRENNDQRRGSLSAWAEVPLSDDVDDANAAVVVRAAAVASAHEGGIPGFSTAPFTDLRGRRSLAAGGLGLTARLAPLLGIGADDVDDTLGRAFVDVDVSGQGSERVTGEHGLGGFFGAPADDASRLAGTRVAARGRLRGRLWADDAGAVDGAVVVEGARADIADAARRHELAAGTTLSLRAPLWSLVGGLDVDGAARLLADTDAVDAAGADRGPVLLPTGSVRLSLARRGLVGFVGVTRAARAPTLDERFAPQGFLLGNPALQPEVVSEAEVGVVVTLVAPVNEIGEGMRVRVRAVGHGSIVDDAIVLVNRSAFAVVPENTGPARRAGVDLGATLRPLPALELGVTASLLHSEVLATHAPLPSAPPFLLRTVGRVFDERASVDVVVTARGESASTLFGTLRAPGFALLDLIGRWSLADNLALTATLQNALDERGARDVNLLPLPGRLFFLSLEVTA